MAVKPQKDPRYKLVQKTPRRYRDVLTGELLNRSEFEKRTKEQPALAGGPAIPQSAPRLQKPLASQENPGVGGHAVDMDSAVDFLTPIAETPEPPPLISGLNQAANLGEDVAKAAAQKSSDTLANIVGDGVAMCLNLIADMRAAPDKRYWVIETDAIKRVTRPAARIVARHLPVEIEAVGPDGKDAAELFNGVMYCVTAVWANKQVFDAEMRRREEEYAALFDQHYGPGSYARARAQAGGQTAGPGGPVPGPTGPGSQGVVSNGNPYAGAARADANGSGNHRGDGGRTAAIIHQLYQQYPGAAGQPPGFGRAV